MQQRWSNKKKVRGWLHLSYLKARLEAFESIRRQRGTACSGTMVNVPEGSTAGIGGKRCGGKWDKYMHHGRCMVDASKKIK